MLKKLFVSIVLATLLSLPITAFANEEVIGHSYVPVSTVSVK